MDDKQTNTTVQRNEVADITLRTKAPVAFDLYADFEVSGRFVLVDDYDVAGGGIITELVQDEQEGLRNEARERDSAWVKGDVEPEQRAKHFGHRASVVLFTGPDTSAKSFLARKLESLLVADGRHAYLLDAENLHRGLDADLREANPAETVRRYGEVARLLTDTGLLIVSTTNSFSLPTNQVVQAIQTLVNPTPVVTVHMTKETQSLQEDMDLTFSGPEDFDDCAHQILALLKTKGILAESLGTRPEFQYSI